jgi:hypothetical protein
MGMINLVVDHHQELGLPPCFIVWLRREAGYGPMDQSAGVLWIVLGAHFFGSTEICPNLLASRERLPCTGTAHRKRTSGVCGLV